MGFGQRQHYYDLAPSGLSRYQGLHCSVSCSTAVTKVASLKTLGFRSHSPLCGTPNELVHLKLKSNL